MRIVMGKIWSDDGHAIRRGVLCFAFNINAAQSVLINLGKKSSVQPARIKFVNLNNGIQKGSTQVDFDMPERINVTTKLQLRNENQKR